VNIAFNVTRQPGKSIVEIKNMSKAYGPIEIFENTSARIERGDKIALIGANGKGKSTLLRIINGREKVEGEVIEGYNVFQGFYAQHQLEALNVNNEILEELKQSGSGKTEQELRTVLGCFLFTGDDVFKKIKTLSGGEKSRVALAKTLISEANFLILDEPTNHLDMQSVNILIQALQQYAGSFVIVSHDRYFISETANKIWYIEDKEIKEYPGVYDEYEYWRRKQEASKQKAVVQETKKPIKEKKPVDDSRISELKKQKKKLEKELEDAEKGIFDLEKLKKEIEAKLSDPIHYENPEQLNDLNKSYQKASEKLDLLQQQWEKLADQLEQIDDEIR
jgi:ATP-binding cassette, subfamily F, member 3